MLVPVCTFLFLSLWRCRPIATSAIFIEQRLVGPRQLNITNDHLKWNKTRLYIRIASRQFISMHWMKTRTGDVVMTSSGLHHSRRRCFTHFLSSFFSHENFCIWNITEDLKRKGEVKGQIILIEPNSPWLNT